MKTHFCGKTAASGLLCAALLLSLSACGSGSGVSPSPSASASASAAASEAASPAVTGPAAAYVGEWVSFASEETGKRVVFEDFSNADCLHLTAENGFTMESRTNGDYKLGSWELSKDGKSAALLDGANDQVFTLTPVDGEDGVARLKTTDGGTEVLAARTDSAAGRAALKQYESAMKTTTGENEDTEHSFTAWCELKPDGDTSSLSADEVIWVSGDDTDALKLFGIDPATVTDDYALYDADATPFLYSIDENGSFRVVSGDGSKTVDFKGLKTAMAASGRILATVKTHGDCVVSLEQIYIP